MKMKKLWSKLRRNWLSVLLIAVVVAVVAFSAYQSHAQRAELQKMKNLTQELSKQVEKLIEVSPTPSASTEPTPFPSPKPQAQYAKPTPQKIYVPDLVGASQERQKLYEKQQQENQIEQQNKNIENICTGSGGHMFFGECRY